MANDKEWVKQNLQLVSNCWPEQKEKQQNRYKKKTHKKEEQRLVSYLC